MNGSGFIRPGLECQQCGLPFALSLGAGVFGRKEVERLEDPFEAKCPMCGRVDIYPKSSIQNLEAQPRQ